MKDFTGTRLTKHLTNALDVTIIMMIKNILVERRALAAKLNPFTSLGYGMSAFCNCHTNKIYSCALPYTDKLKHFIRSTIYTWDHIYPCPAAGPSRVAGGR